MKEGDKVLIKPNICGGNPKIEGSFTCHEVVEELVKMVREVDADPIVADADMIWTQFEPVAEEQGWMEWADRTNVPLVNLTKTERVYFDFGKESATGIVPVSKELVDADVIISVPTMKTHLLTSITIGMKNMYGTFPQENKAKYHRFGIEDVICDVNRAFTPNLTGTRRMGIGRNPIQWSRRSMKVWSRTSCCSRVCRSSSTLQLISHSTVWRRSLS